MGTWPPRPLQGALSTFLPPPRPTESSPSVACSDPALHLRSYRRSASRARRAPPEPLGPMAKRRAAEPLTFHVPWKRLLLCDFPEEPPPPPPLWIPPPGASHPGQLLGVSDLPRKRRIDSGAMTEPAASPSKRRDGGDISAPGGAECEDRGLETGEPSLLQPPERPSGPGEESRGALPPRGGGDDGAGRAESPRRDWGAAPLQVGAGGGMGAAGAVGGHPFPGHYALRDGADSTTPYPFVKTPPKAKSRAPRFRNGCQPQGNTARAPEPTLGSGLGESDGLKAFRFGRGN